MLRGLGIVSGSGENRDGYQIQSLLTRSGMVVNDQVKSVAFDLSTLNSVLLSFKLTPQQQTK